MGVNLDEFRLCDEVGLDIMVNEHHSTSTCLTVSVPMALAVIARETKRARLLSLGTPIANRPDPVRVAEEMAWLDVLSGGRLEMGLVKGAPYEIAPANSNPANLMRRYWEAHGLILKAMSTTDGPFSWEGEFFHYRNVNVWPRPYQQPTPPVWMTGLSPETGRMAAKSGGKRGGFVRDRNGNPVDQRTATIEQLIESGTCFAGTPDDSVGGFGNLLMSLSALIWLYTSQGEDKRREIRPSGGQPAPKHTSGGIRLPIAW